MTALFSPPCRPLELPRSLFPGGRTWWLPEEGKVCSITMSTCSVQKSDSGALPVHSLSPAPFNHPWCLTTDGTFGQNVKSVLICHADIAAFDSRAKEHSCLHQDCQDCFITLDKMNSPPVTSSWEKLLANSLDTLAFRITSIGRHIVMICHPRAPSTFLYTCSSLLSPPLLK